jgi:hypothetical protein
MFNKCLKVCKFEFDKKIFWLSKLGDCDVRNLLANFVEGLNKGLSILQE